MIGLFWVVINIVSAILIYNDAKKRGMNALLWAIIVIFTSLFGIIAYFIFRKPIFQGQKFRGGLNERIGKR